MKKIVIPITIRKKDYDKIAEDIKRNGASGRIQSIQRAFTDFAQFDKQRDSARRAESSPHSLQVEHGGENSEVLRDSKTATPRGQTQNDGGGDSKSRRSSKQGIKYSLKVGNEEIGGTIEETKNLVALHNLSEEKLLKVLQLGGFPMPSIAITKRDKSRAGLSHENIS